jgi:two-component system, LytTR family, sensor kinase
MRLQMKGQCQKCGEALASDDRAYICSFECTFCPGCASSLNNVCPDCGEELVLRPRRAKVINSSEAVEPPPSAKIHPGLLWTLSFAVWTFISLAATATIYAMYHMTNGRMGLGRIAGMEFSEILTYAPLTPFVFAFAARYPVQRENWLSRSLAHFGAAIVFSFGHVTLKAFTPYGYWDPVYREWTSAIWDPHTHALRISWMIAKSMFLADVVDDFSAAYIPIALIAHVVAYYSRFRERELRATQLEGQLAKAHLQTLKSQLQPHFLFNTLNSISALMLTDVAAADRMMISLGDLLRMSLKENENQITTLARETEFLSLYLEIERIRFEDKLHVLMDIAPNCLDAQVPHLLLQPLVENAVRHGISRRSDPGEVSVVAKHQGRHLEIWIRDTGPGLSLPRPAVPSHGLGLKITQDRLFALYGSDQAFEIHNRPEGGAEVHLRIPFSVAPVSARLEAAAESYI